MYYLPFTTERKECDNIICEKVAGSYIYVVYMCVCMCVYTHFAHFLPLMHIKIETLTHEFTSLGTHGVFNSRISFESKTNLLKFPVVNMILNKGQ